MDKTKKLGHMVAPVAPVYTLMLAPNGLKKAWPPGKNPQNRYVISLICMSVISNSLKYKKRRIRKRRIASTRRIRRGKKRRIRRYMNNKKLKRR